jgi:hypothetical protein
LSTFDLAALGAAGFREWALLEPLAGGATCELQSNVAAAQAGGYNALNRAWLVSALLTLRGFGSHLAPAVSGYSWSLIAGHQAASAPSFRKQLAEEGVDAAVHKPRSALPPFRGGLLDFHTHLQPAAGDADREFTESEAEWFRTHFDRFDKLAGQDQRFRFALEAGTDWRFGKEPRAALARLWSGIEALLNVNQELVYRLSMTAASLLRPRGPDRVAYFDQVKRLYGIRSKAVHGDVVSEKDLETGVVGAFELLRGLLLDAVERGEVRTERELVAAVLSA